MTSKVPALPEAGIISPGGVRTDSTLVARRSSSTLILLCVAHFFIDLYSSALAAFQPMIVDRMGISLAQAGLLGGLRVFSSSTTQPLYGYLSDRFRSRMFVALAPAMAGIFISLLGAA
ncbi:MAG: hypothetical protein NTV70_11000, partial [Acidobacteria bacterium]|nr:hypothetical protein [Acidobacteriota bacterium]